MKTITVLYNKNKQISIASVKCDNEESCDLSHLGSDNNKYKKINVEDIAFCSPLFDAFVLNDDMEMQFLSNKAKEIWLEHYRRARTPLLAKLDVDFMRAVEAGDTDLQKEIASKKQALRDVTKTELPNDLEGIKNTWPEILGNNPFNK